MRIYVWIPVISNRNEILNETKKTMIYINGLRKNVRYNCRETYLRFITFIMVLNVVVVLLKFFLSYFLFSYYLFIFVGKVTKVGTVHTFICIYIYFSTLITRCLICLSFNGLTAMHEHIG